MPAGSAEAPTCGRWWPRPIRSGHCGSWPLNGSGFYAPALQISGAPRSDSILHALDDHIAEGSSEAATLLRADTPIGRVEIGHGIAATAVEAALTRAEASRAILLVEPQTWAVAGNAIATYLTSRDWIVRKILLPRGEEAKRLRVIEKTCRALARLGVDRGETLVAIGGGALTDAAGFAAATYLRGVKIVHVPTTLVCQIDAALGGKTAVDIPEGKNLIGAFHQPTAFIADTAFLRSLPSRQRRAALGEVVKMAVLGDERLLEVVEAEGRGLRRRQQRPDRLGRRGGDGRTLRLGQGPGRDGRRARLRPADDAQSGPHAGPRDRSGGRIQRPPPRRGGRLRVARSLRDLIGDGPDHPRAISPDQLAAGPPEPRDRAARRSSRMPSWSTWPTTRSTRWASSAGSCPRRTAWRSRRTCPPAAVEFGLMAALRFGADHHHSPGNGLAGSPVPVSAIGSANEPAAEPGLP